MKTKSKKKSNRLDLGLAVSGATCIPGVERGYKTIAAYCDCSPQAIEQISDKACHKVRVALRRRYGIISTEIKTQ